MGPWPRAVQTGYADKVTDEAAAEAAFQAWLDQFKDTLPDRTALGVFLSTDHLRKAFLAGLEAGSRTAAKA